MDEKLLDNEYYTFRIIMVGDTFVGKSCMLLKFTDNRFIHHHDITIGVEFGSKTLQIDDTTVKVNVWDTAGQEVFRSITRSYYRNVCGVVLMYDVTKRETYHHIENWIRDIHEDCPKKKSIILVGNKIDLVSSRSVSYQEGQLLAKRHGLMFMETSVKTGKNVSDCFSLLAKDILKKIKSEEIPIHRDNGITVCYGAFGDTSFNKEEKRSCCF